MNFHALVSSENYRLDLMHSVLCDREEGCNGEVFSEATVSVSFWGQRLVYAPGHGEISLHELTEAVYQLAQRKLSGDDYAMGTAIVNKIRNFYEITDPEVNSRLGARFIEWIQSIFCHISGRQNPRDLLKDDPQESGMLVLMFEQSYREFQIHSIAD